jgi:hypothetical protein
MDEKLPHFGHGQSEVAARLVPVVVSAVYVPVVVSTVCVPLIKGARDTRNM